MVRRPGWLLGKLSGLEFEEGMISPDDRTRAPKFSCWPSLQRQLCERCGRH